MMAHVLGRAALLAVGFAAICSNAYAATIDVPCGSGEAQLKQAITNANLDAAPDTIQLTGGPCTFSLTTPASTAAGNNNTGLPIVTRPLTIEGNGSTIERSASAVVNFRILFANGPDAALTIRNLTVQRGLLAGGNVGAGIVGFQAPLVIESSTVTGNTTSGSSGSPAVPASGGGVATIGGSLLIDHSTIAFNSAGAGGGLATSATGTAQAPAVIRRSLFRGNTANTVGAAYIQGGVAEFENDTFAANAAANGVAGVTAGTSGATGSTVTVASSTFADSTRTGGTAPANALFAFPSGSAGATIEVSDTVVTDSDSTAPPAIAPCHDSTPGGTIDDNGGNLEWPGTSCGFGTNANPLLSNATFGANGGPTSTYRPPPGSPVIDLGGAACPATDQRDVARPDGEGCDAGAYETPAPETVASGPATSPTNDPAVTFSSPDTPSATFQCKVDTGGFGACTSPFEPSLGDGQHTVMVRAVAGAGYLDPSPAAVTFTVDTSAPTVQITGAPPTVTDDNTPTIAFTVDDAGATVTCRVDAGDAAPCSSPYTTGELADGEHTVTVAAGDAAGNSGSASASFRVDSAPPVVEITGAPASPSSDPNATIEFTVEDAGATTTTCQVDDGAAEPCSSPWETPELSEGRHTVTVAATDAAGNSASASASFGVSFAPPETTIASGPSGTMHEASATFSFTSSKPGSTFECRLDGADWGSCTSPHTVSGYSEGTHTFAVRATDIRGGVDPTPASRAFTYKKCNVLKVPLPLLGRPFVICV